MTTAIAPTASHVRDALAVLTVAERHGLAAPMLTAYDGLGVRIHVDSDEQLHAWLRHLDLGDPSVTSDETLMTDSDEDYLATVKAPLVSQPAARVAVWLHRPSTAAERLRLQAVAL